MVVLKRLQQADFTRLQRKTNIVTSNSKDITDMSTSTDSSETTNYTFKPALQDISLKRFRLRYSIFDDCYYLHWDTAVCPPLAKITGLTNGVHYISGVTRYIDDSSGQAYLGFEKGAESAQVKWHLDFSCSGLAIHRMEVKARCGWGEERGQEAITFTVEGDNKVFCSPELGDYYTELYQVSGCKSVTISAKINRNTSVEGPVQLLSGDADSDCPLDIIAELMVPRRDDWLYAGELLMGLKYTPDECSIKSDLLSDEAVAGHLQVHIVEGAGFVDEESRKPFNTFVKCELIPGRISSKQTSPQHSAYPTWAKELCFSGVPKESLLNGGLEVILYDHHHFSHDINIGGLRFCIPEKKPAKSFSLSPDASPARSQSISPVPGEISISYADSGSINGDHSPISPLSATGFEQPDDKEEDEEVIHRRTKSRSLPNSASFDVLSGSSPTLSPVVTRRSVSPNTLSPAVSRKHFSPKSSPIIAAKNLFRLSGSHLLGSISPLSSPRGSPILGRKKMRKNLSRNNSIETDYVFWWMEDASSGEVKHWQQMLDNEGKWIYFWHLIQPKMKPAY